MDNVEEPLRDAFSLPPEHDESLLGILADGIERTVSTEQWAEVREEAWVEAVRSDWRADETPDHECD